MFRNAANKFEQDLTKTKEKATNDEINANKKEIENWSKYPINDDPNPEIIRRPTEQQVIYNQEVAIRYLRPPTPPAPGEIIIRQVSNHSIPPAPPLIIRQNPVRPQTPPPLVVREAPPTPPRPVERRVIIISGKNMPPPPRKVIIERLPQLPTKPQSIIIERWLPYKPIKRRVVFTRAPYSGNNHALLYKPKNIIVQWDPPKVEIRKEFKDLGIVRANPIEYIERYGPTLKQGPELPTFIKEIKPPKGVILAADVKKPYVYELEGDVHALALVDLERENLTEYRSLLRSNNVNTYMRRETAKPGNHSFLESYAGLLNQMYNSIEIDKNNKMEASEAKVILFRLVSRLSKFVTHDLTTIFKNLSVDENNRVDFNQFKYIFESFLSNK